MGKLTWECNGIEIVLSDDEKANIFCDVDNLPCSVTGSFDRRSAPGMQGTNTYASSLSGMQITISGAVMARNMGSKSRPVDRVLTDYRKLLCNAFNPLFVGKLTRDMGDGLYFVEARANSLLYLTPYSVEPCRFLWICTRMNLTGNWMISG